MAPRAAATCIVVMVLGSGAVSQAQPCDCAIVADTRCGGACDVRPPPEPPDLAELRAVEASAIATGVAAWVFTTIVASQQQHFVLPVDTIPVVGGINSAVKNQSHDAPLLLFAASTQVMSILVAVVAGLELAEEKQRWRVSVGGSCDGAGVMLGGSF